MTQLEYSGPHRGVQRVGGHRPYRRDARGGDDWAGIEYTSPAGYVTAVDGRAPARRRVVNQVDDSAYDSDYDERAARYEQAQRRYDARMARLANPDHAVYGRCVPYGVVLDGGLGDQVLFTSETEWVLRRPDLPLLIEHSGLLGSCRLDEVPNGLYAHGNIYSARRHVVGDRHDLSPKLTLLDTVTRPDGVLEVRSASLAEISLVRRPHWAPHTTCLVYQRPAA